MTDFEEVDINSFAHKHSKITTMTTICIEETNRTDMRVDDQKPSGGECAFFEGIFDKASGSIKADHLKTLDMEFTEVFDANKLAFIINNEKAVKKLYREDAHDNVCLGKFYELSKDGEKPTSYKQIDNGLFGRLYATSESGQGMVREVRHTIFNEHYIDLDIDNCHPVITVALCNWLGLDCHYMQEYVVNRENQIKKLMSMNPNTTREDIKHLFLSINYGGRSSYNKMNKNEFIKRYAKEVSSNRKNILDIFKDFRDTANALCRAKNVKRGFNADYNLDGSALSQLCGLIENYILMMVLEYLKGKISIKNCILCFDGVMINRNLFDSSIIPDLEKIFGDMGLHIMFSTKSMYPLDIENMGYSASMTYEVKKSNISTKKQTADDKLLEFYTELGGAISSLDKNLISVNDGIEFNDLLMHYETFSVDELALMIRQTIVRVENSGEPVYFVKEMFENKYKRTLVRSIRYALKPSNAMSKYDVSIVRGDDVLTVKLSDVLSSVRQHISYRKAVNEPYGALEHNTSDKRQAFNLYPGFIHAYDETFAPDSKIVSTWADHIKHVLANDDDAVYTHLLRIFKHMLINPMDKTGTIIIIKGVQGSGKNSVFDVFYRYVLGPQVSLTTPNLDLVVGRFNAIRQSLIACCLDEALDAMDRSANNKFKNLITADEVQIEQKGKDAYTVADYCNYCVISNNDFASLVEESDRRAFCMETNNSKKGDKAYWKNYYDVLDGVDAGKHIFHWLINEVYIPSDWRAQDIPQTRYKVELKESQASSTVKFLLDILRERIETDLTEETTYSNKEMWDMFREFCDQNKHKCISSTAFYRILTRYTRSCTVSNVRSKTISVSILREKLSEYLY